VSITVAFFLAADDDEAAEAEARPGGPLGWPVEVGVRKAGLFRREPIIEELGPAYDGFAARGYDGVVNMGTLEELLTGRPYADLEEDPRWGWSVSDDPATEEDGALTITDSLRDALAATSDSKLAEVVLPWASTEELGPRGGGDPTLEDLAGHLVFLTELRDLAVRGKAADKRLYWYFGA